MSQSQGVDQIWEHVRDVRVGMPKLMKADGKLLGYADLDETWTNFFQRHGITVSAQHIISSQEPYLWSWESAMDEPIRPFINCYEPERDITKPYFVRLKHRHVIRICGGAAVGPMLWQSPQPGIRGFPCGAPRRAETQDTTLFTPVHRSNPRQLWSGGLSPRNQNYDGGVVGGNQNHDGGVVPENRNHDVAVGSRNQNHDGDVFRGNQNREGSVVPRNQQNHDGGVIHGIRNHDGGVSHGSQNHDGGFSHGSQNHDGGFSHGSQNHDGGVSHGSQNHDGDVFPRNLNDDGARSPGNQNEDEPMDLSSRASSVGDISGLEERRVERLSIQMTSGVLEAIVARLRSSNGSQA